MTQDITESVWLNTSDICSLEHIAEVSGLSQEDILDLVHTGVLPPSSHDRGNYFFTRSAWSSLTGQGVCETISSLTRKAWRLPCACCAGLTNSKPNSPTLKPASCAQGVNPLQPNRLTAAADKLKLKNRPSPLHLRFVWQCCPDARRRPVIL